jgi:putative transposase
MRKSRFTEVQIIHCPAVDCTALHEREMIKEQEAGMPIAEVCRRHGLSPASFYKFKPKMVG